MAKMSERAKGRRADTLYKKALKKACKTGLPKAKRMAKKFPQSTFWRLEVRSWTGACRGV